MQVNNVTYKTLLVILLYFTYNPYKLPKPKQHKYINNINVINSILKSLLKPGCALILKNINNNVNNKELHNQIIKLDNT